MRFTVPILFALFLIPSAVLSAQNSDAEITSFMSAGDFNPDLDYAQVLKVEARRAANGTWFFNVRVEHRDEILEDGSDHYADRWEVVDPRSGKVLARRILTHPHINEMPFSRSMSGIEIPEDLREVLVRAGCTHHGFEGRQVIVPLVDL